MRYYIDKLGIKHENTPQGWNLDDDRQKEWAKEREKYGFDERETWSLYYTMNLLLYERLCMYKDITIVNMDYHKFEFKDEILTFRECIDRMIKGLELDLTLDDYDKRRTEPEISKCIDEVYEIYAICKNALWW